MDPLKRTQALFAPQPLKTQDVGPRLPSMQRPPVPNDPREFDRVMQWNAQQKPLQAGTYGDGQPQPPQVPAVGAAPPRPATAGMVSPQNEGVMEGMMPMIGAEKFIQFPSSSMEGPLDGIRNADTDRLLGSSDKPKAISPYTGRRVGLPLPPNEQGLNAVAQQLASRGAPPPNSEHWRTVFGADPLSALQMPEQIHAAGLSVKKKGGKK